MASPMICLRKSGLVRGLNTLDVFLFNVFGYSLGLALTTNPSYIGGFAPLANIRMVLFFGLLAALLNGVTYGVFGAIMPRSGGDYVFISRTLNQFCGFIASWGFTLAQVFGFAVNCTWAITWALVPGAYTYGAASGKSQYMQFAVYANKDTVSVVLALVCMMLVFFVALRGIKFTNWFVLLLFVCGVFGTLLQGYAFFSTTHAEFVNRFESFMVQHTGTPDAYHKVVMAAGSTNRTPMNVFYQSLKATPLGFLVFLGFTYSVYVGSEVLKPSKAQLKGILLALAFGAVVFFAIMGRYMAVVGSEFNSCLGSPPSTVSFPAGVSVTFFAGILLRNPALNFLMNFGNLVWFALVPVVILQVCSRNLHVWALDCLAPEVLAKTNRFGFPWIAGLVIVMIGVIFVIISHFTGVTLVAATALVALPLFLAGLAAARLPYNRPQEFELAPPFARKLVGGVPLIVLLGIATSLAFSWVFFASIHYSQISSAPDDKRALIWVGAIYGAGTIYYLWMRAWLNRRLKKSGLTIEDIWGVLPPA